MSHCGGGDVWRFDELGFHCTIRVQRQTPFPDTSSKPEDFVTIKTRYRFIENHGTLAYVHYFISCGKFIQILVTMYRVGRINFLLMNKSYDIGDTQYDRQFTNLPKRGWGKVGAWLGHGARLGHGWGKVGARGKDEVWFM